jgi:hypothetical protein
MQIDLFLAWSAGWAASGIRPDEDFDRPWSVANKMSQRLKPFLVHEGRKVRFILVEFRGDWDQYSGGFGFPRSNQHHFCWVCPCTKNLMYDDALPDEYRHADYERLVEKCIVDVLVDRSAAERIFNSLGLDCRKDKGMHGRVVMCPTVIFDHRTRMHVALLKHDRLEVGGCCRDIYATASSLFAGKFPFRLVFWRRHPAVDFSFRSPLLDVLQLEHLMIDDLHTLDLGPAARLGGHIAVAAVGKLFGNDASENGLKTGCRLLNKKFRSWRKGKQWRGIWKLTPGLIGLSSKDSTGHLHCKAGEARTFLPFALHLAKELSPHLGVKGPFLVRAVEALMGCFDIIKTKSPTVDGDKLGDMLDECMSCSRDAGVRLLHKFHLMRHMRSLSKRAGNPSRFSAYPDETKNSETIKIALKSSTADFASRVLCRDHLQFHDGAQKR